MKKKRNRQLFLTIAMFFMAFFGLYSVSALEGNVTFDPVFMDEKVYDWDTGVLTDTDYYGSTSKMNIGTVTTIVFDTHFSYIYFWDKYGGYLGYYNNLGTRELSKYRGDVTLSVTPPESAKTFAISTLIPDQTTDVVDAIDNPIISGYVIYSIDDPITVVEGYSDYTYRDIFGDSLYGTGRNNMVENGDFSNSGFTLTDEFTTNSTGTMEYENQKLKFTITSTPGYEGLAIKTSYIPLTDHFYYVNLDIIPNWTDTSIGYFYFQNNVLNTYDNIMQDGVLNNTSKIVKASGINSSIIFYTRLNSEIGSIAYFDNIIVYDLTALFGSGNEPSKADFEIMLDEYTHIIENGADTTGDGLPDSITLSSMDDTLVTVENAFADGGTYTGYVSDMVTQSVSVYSVENLITNGNFKTDLSNWTIASDDADGYVRFSSSRVHIVSIAGVNKYISKSGLLTVAKDYYLSFNYQIVSGAGIATEGLLITPIVSGSSIYGHSITATGTGFVLKRNSTASDFYADNIMIFDMTVDGYTSTVYDLLVSQYPYIDGLKALPDLTDTDFTDHYIQYFTTDSYATYGEMVIIPDVDSDGNLYLSFGEALNWNQANFETYIDIYYNGDYGTNPETLVVGDTYFDSFDIISARLLYALLDVDGWDYTDFVDPDNATLANWLSLYWDYKNGVDRWEWYSSYGVTSAADLAEYYTLVDDYDAVDGEGEITLYLDFIETGITGTYTYTDETPDDAVESFGDLLTDTMKIIISIGLVVVLTLFLAKIGAPMSIILILDLALLLLFVILAWLPSWIGLVLGAIAFISLIVSFRDKGGGA